MKEVRLVAEQGSRGSAVRTGSTLTGDSARKRLADHNLEVDSKFSPSDTRVGARSLSIAGQARVSRSPAQGAEVCDKVITESQGPRK